ncbi:MAG: hypothetical protein ACI4RL_06470 [Ruminococcus sp.]
MYKSIKIADATREERIEIVKNSLSFGEESCEGSVGFDVMSMYQPYIDGRKEIAQINMEFHSGMIR